MNKNENEAVEARGKAGVIATGQKKFLSAIFLLTMFAVTYIGGYLSFTANLARNDELSIQLNDIVSSTGIELKSAMLFFTIADIISITVTVIMALLINVIILKVIRVKIPGMKLAAATMTALAAVQITAYIFMTFIPADFPQIGINSIANILEIIVLTLMLSKYLSQNHAVFKFIVIRSGLCVLNMAGQIFLTPALMNVAL